TPRVGTGTGRVPPSLPHLPALRKGAPCRTGDKPRIGRFALWERVRRASAPVASSPSSARGSPLLRFHAQRAAIGVHHLAHQRLETYAVLPPQFLARLAGVALQQIHFSRPEQVGVGHHIAT